jgi:hypothetical protein
MVEHRFGGSWTERKLEALRDYLVQYRLIFTRHPAAAKLRTIYVDAFAGTGERDSEVQDSEASLFGYAQEGRKYREGSVYKALSIDSKFHEYIFIERLCTEFAGVVEHPLILENAKHTPMYALCFAAGNPKGAPTAVKIAAHLTRS